MSEKKLTEADIFILSIRDFIHKQKPQLLEKARENPNNVRVRDWTSLGAGIMSDLTFGRSEVFSVINFEAFFSALNEAEKKQTK